MQPGDDRLCIHTLMTWEKRSHIVTADVTYRGHIFVLADNGEARIESRDRDTVLRRIWQASAESRDGQIYRVEGVDADGASVVWRVVSACARCSNPAVYPTPAFDVPT